MAHQGDGIGDIGLGGAGQQALRIDAGGDDPLEQGLALGDAEGIGLARGAEQGDAVAAILQEGMAMGGEGCVIGRAVFKDRGGRGAEDAANGEIARRIGHLFPPARRRA